MLISDNATIYQIFEDGDLGQFEGTYEWSWEELVAVIKDPHSDNLGGDEGDDLPAHVQLYRRAQAAIENAKKKGLL